MNRMKAILRKLYFWALVWGSWFALEGVAWANQAKKETKDDSSNITDWVFPYMIVILCIALGMLVVCRSARRSERAKPQQYESLKTRD